MGEIYQNFKMYLNKSFINLITICLLIGINKINAAKKYYYHCSLDRCKQLLYNSTKGAITYIPDDARIIEYFNHNIDICNVFKSNVRKLRVDNYVAYRACSSNSGFELIDISNLIDVNIKKSYKDEFSYLNCFKGLDGCLKSYCIGNLSIVFRICVTITLGSFYANSKIQFFLIENILVRTTTWSPCML